VVGLLFDALRRSAGPALHDRRGGVANAALCLRYVSWRLPFLCLRDGDDPGLQRRRRHLDADPGSTFSVSGSGRSRSPTCWRIPDGLSPPRRVPGDSDRFFDPGGRQHSSSSGRGKWKERRCRPDAARLRAWGWPRAAVGARCVKSTGVPAGIAGPVDVGRRPAWGRERFFNRWRKTSPAARAGLLPGDQLLTLDGTAVDGAAPLEHLLLARRPRAAGRAHPPARHGEPRKVGGAGRRPGFPAEGLHGRPGHGVLRARPPLRSGTKRAGRPGARQPALRPGLPGRQCGGVRRARRPLSRRFRWRLRRRRRGAHPRAAPPGLRRRQRRGLRAPCLHLRHGEGVPQDDDQAFRLYQTACEGGDAAGCYNVGLHFEKARGTVENSSLALLAYGVPATSGRLRLHQPRLPPRAAAWAVPRTRSAWPTSTAAPARGSPCEKGDPLGCFNLGSSTATARACRPTRPAPPPSSSAPVPGTTPSAAPTWLTCSTQATACPKTRSVPPASTARPATAATPSPVATCWPCPAWPARRRPRTPWLAWRQAARRPRPPPATSSAPSTTVAWESPPTRSAPPATT